MSRPLHQRARVLRAAERDLSVRPVREPIDWDCINRLSDYAAARRAEMGEARWQELQKEWNA